MVSPISANGVMAMRNAILQKNQALRDVAGPALDKLPGAGGTPQAAPSDFTQALSSALNDVSAMQSRSSEAAAAYERGETNDIAAVMLARQQASIGFETTLQVRNKLLSAYKDIMSMPV